MQRLQRLNLTPHLDPATGKDLNPCTMPEATLYRETLTLGPLDVDELATFKAQFGALLAAPGSEERKLMLDRLSAYVIALRAIKHELNDVKFAGLNPEDTEIGFGTLRPQFTIAGAAVTNRKTTWSIAFAASATWYDWFHVAAAAYSVGKDFGMVITHLKSLVTPAPFMSEARFEVGRTGILIPVDVRGLRIGDTENGVSIVPIPTMIVKPKGSFFGRAKADVAGTDEVVLGGLIIGLGRVLKEETATWTA